MKITELVNVSINDIRKDVMQYAWYLAKKAAARFGGKASDYVSNCVKKAWRRVKDKYYRVCAKMQLANYLADITEIYYATNRTRVLSWAFIRDNLYEKGVLPESGTMDMLEDYAFGLANKYVFKLNSVADCQIREPLDIRKRLIFDYDDIVDVNRVALGVMCDNAAYCYGFGGYSWTNTYLNSCEKNITEMYAAGKEDGFVASGDYVEKLRSDCYITMSEFRHLLDYHYYVYLHYKEVMEKYYESSWA